VRLLPLRKGRAWLPLMPRRGTPQRAAAAVDLRARFVGSGVVPPASRCTGRFRCCAGAVLQTSARSVFLQVYEELDEKLQASFQQYLAEVIRGS
jgi:hypothetical protein